MTARAASGHARHHARPAWPSGRRGLEYAEREVAMALTSVGFGEESARLAEDSEKQNPFIYRIAEAPALFHLYRASTADRVLQESERHRIVDREIIERDAPTRV